MMFFFLVFVCNIFFWGLLQKKNKFFSYIIFLILAVFFVGLTGGPDYEIYKLNYEYSTKYTTWGFEPLYQMVVLAGKKLSLRFEDFFGLYAILGLC